MACVIAEVNQDIENLRAQNSAQDHENAEIPGLFRVNFFAARVVHADPESNQHTQGNQKTIGGQAEVADMKESRKH